MRRVFVALAVMLSMAVPAMAVDFTFHGDLNNRSRLLTNHSEFTNGLDQSTSLTRKAIINDGSGSDFLVDYKYRLWVDAASDDGAIKGVFGVEVAESFGNSDTSFSGDSKDSLKVRWAYTDFALAGGRTKIGLQSMNINHYFWEETAAGINFKKPLGDGSIEAAWYRPNEMKNTADNNDFKDQDALYLRYNLNAAEGVKVGFFAAWITSDGDTASDGIGAPTNWYLKKMSTTAVYTQNPTTYAVTKAVTAVDMDLYTVGIDGNMKSGDLFANWDLMYQMGDYAEAYDFGGYFAHFDIGMKMGKGKLTYTFWYASGDDDDTDGDLDAFVAVDVDMFDSVVFFESFTDSNYFSATPYLQDKGMIFNRLSYDYQATDKLKIGASAIYMMTAEDLEYQDDLGLDQKDDTIGLEFDAYIKYQLFSKTEFAIEAGYLMADDVMDFYEADCDGSSDEDIWLIDTRLRYKF